MNTIPIGGLLFAWCTLMAVMPIRRPWRLAVLSFLSSAGPIEVPFVFLLIVVASNVPTLIDGDLATATGWISPAVALLTVVGLLVVVRRALRTRSATDRALDDALGAEWRSHIDPGLREGLRRRLPWGRILFVPWPLRPRSVERIADVAYGDRGKSNLLDVYRHRSHPAGSPTLVYFHGGRFRWGKKSREARALLFRLASRGWTCISANYHLSPTPAEGFPQHLVDVKRVIAWVRVNGHEYGADPGMLFVAGSSAGAHLTAMAALTANDPTFQPGFESVDTSITAGVGLGGYYGRLGGDEDPPTSPLDYVNPDMPPFFIAHGEQDTYTPLEGARELAAHLRATSSQPVVCAELPGGQHAFDLFHSIRFETVVDAIEVFAAWCQATSRSSPLSGRRPHAATCNGPNPR